MRQVSVVRTESDDRGTFGNLKTDSGFQCYSLELPWRDNKVGLSCIFPGPNDPEYIVQGLWLPSVKHGHCYHLQNVLGRTDVEIHAANWAGDASRGLKCQLLGCLAPGRAIGDLVGQKAILSSKDALDGLVVDLAMEPFMLTISWAKKADLKIPQK